MRLTPTFLDDIGRMHYSHTFLDDGDLKPPAKKLKQSDENETAMQPLDKSDNSDKARPAARRVSDENEFASVLTDKKKASTSLSKLPPKI